MKYEWQEGGHWIRDTYRGKQLTLADNFEYRYYAKQMGYENLDLLQIQAIRILFAGHNTLGAWMQSHRDNMPDWWHKYGFRDSDQICCFASIHFRDIQEWCATQ